MATHPQGLPGTETTRISKPRWMATASVICCQVVVDDQSFGEAPPAPILESLDSLNRRFEASDKSWIAEWLAEDDDPCSPA